MLRGQKPRMDKDRKRARDKSQMDQREQGEDQAFGASIPISEPRKIERLRSQVAIREP